MLSLVVLAAGAAGSVAAEGLRPISPGAADRIVEITNACPTFSWAAPSVAPRTTSQSSDQVTVVVVDVTRADRSAASEQDAVALTATLPGGARSWTPSAEQCLEPGRNYRWFVVEDDGQIASRQVSDVRGHAFAISDLPSETAIDWARDILRRHLGDPTPARPARAANVRRPPGARPPAEASRLVSEDQPEVDLSSTFSGDATVGILGATHVKGLHAVKNSSSSGHIVAEGSIISQASPILGNGITFTDSAGNNQIVVSPPDLNFDLQIGGWVAAGTLDATTRVSATAVQVLSGSFTGDDGGTGVEYVDQKDCGFLGLDKCIRVDENETFCSGGSFVVAARLWQTDDDQVGVQVKCTDPLPLSNP